MGLIALGSPHSIVHTQPAGLGLCSCFPHNTAKRGLSIYREGSFEKVSPVFEEGSRWELSVHKLRPADDAAYCVLTTYSMQGSGRGGDLVRTFN